MKNIILLAALLTFPASAHAASFDCAKAATAIEKMVCADPELSKLDDKMSTVYKEKLAVAINTGGVWGMQKDWHSLMNTKCHDKACVKADYEVQISALETYDTEEYTANYKTAIENNLSVANMTKDGFDFGLMQINIDDGKVYCELMEGKRIAIYTTPARDKAEWKDKTCTVSFKITRGPKKTDNTFIDITSAGCEALCPDQRVFDDHYITSYEPVAANQ